MLPVGVQAAEVLTAAGGMGSVSPLVRLKALKGHLGRRGERDCCRTPFDVLMVPEVPNETSSAQTCNPTRDQRDLSGSEGSTKVLHVPKRSG